MKKRILPLLLCLTVLLSACNLNTTDKIENSIPQSERIQVSSPTQKPISSVSTTEAPISNYHINIDDIPAFAGNPYVSVNNNIPSFTDADMTTNAFENYSPLDSLGRCGVAYANICRELMPTEERQGIGQVKPAGWHTVRYEVVGAGSAGFLYNRCHLIAHELAGEDANVLNLITGTRYMNMTGMRGFEDSVADYVRSTGNHALYRVTPIYEGNNLLCMGVQIEAKSVEDNGNAISFNVFCYNVQPGVIIDYATGESWLDETAAEPQTDNKTQENVVDSVSSEAATYILNTNTKKFHYPYCSSVNDMKEKNKREFTGNRDDVINQGYVPCQRCCP